jgi:hypothetical protein
VVEETAASSITGEGLRSIIEQSFCSIAINRNRKKLLRKMSEGQL